MIQLKGMDHLVLRVQNLEAMIDFYCQVIGCSVEWRRPDLGLVHLRAGDALIDLVPVDGPGGIAGGAAPGAEGRNLDHFCLSVREFDIETIVRHLEAHGVPSGKVESRYGASGRGMSIYLRDPEGNGLELKGENGVPDLKQQEQARERAQ